MQFRYLPWLLPCVSLACNSKAMTALRSESDASTLRDSGDASDFGTDLDAQAGTAQPTILAAGLSFPAALTVDDSNVYWFDLGTAPADSITPQPWVHGQVMKCAKGGCAGIPTVLASDRVSAYYTSCPFFSDSLNVYWSDGTTGVPDVIGVPQLFKCSTNGCGSSPQSLFVGNISAIVADGTNAYWTTGTPAIDTCGVSGSVSGGELVSVQGTNVDSTVLVMDQTDIYWATVDSVMNGAIWRCPKAGCNDVPVAVETSTATESGAAQIALDVDTLYFFEDGKTALARKRHDPARSLYIGREESRA